MMMEMEYYLKEREVVSKVTLERLSVYLRELLQIQIERRTAIISSEKLGKRVGFSRAQVRKDLASFGYFGKKGVGYVVRDLIANIRWILGLHTKRNIAIIGAGHLGLALAGNSRIISWSFNLDVIFDNDPKKIGRYSNGVKIADVDQLEELIKDKDIQIAIITTPAQAAQNIADRLIGAGIKGIWNFAPVRLQVPDKFPLVSEDLSTGLDNLAYSIKSSTEDGETADN